MASSVDYVSLAAKWRRKHGYVGKVGFVIVYAGVADGWSARLRKESGWLAGCVAVGEDGSLFEAKGGDEFVGADRWEPIA